MSNELIYQYQNLVFSLMRYFENYKSKEDLFQVGCIGIIKAYQNYKPDQGTKFSTYAYSYIFGEMKKLVREDKGIKISKQITILNSKIEKAKILLSQKLMREPTNDELSSYLEIPEYLIDECQKSNIPITSLESPIASESKDVFLADIISSKEIDINTLIAVREELSKLSKEEKILLQESINQNLTQTELAEKYNMSQVQVSRKIKKIKDRIKSNVA